MNEDILKKFDNLPEGSIILNLGDILVSSRVSFDDLKLLVDRMKSNNKKLWLVMGNHDRTLSRFFKMKKSSYSILLAAGFDRVYDMPIYMDDIIFCHEPIYFENNTSVCYGHLHNKDITSDYFSSNDPTKKEVNTKNYFNVCYDKHFELLPYETIFSYFNKQ